MFHFDSKFIKQTVRDAITNMSEFTADMMNDCPDPEGQNIGVDRADDIRDRLLDILDDCLAELRYELAEEIKQTKFSATPAVHFKVRFD